MTGGPSADTARIDGLFELAFRRHEAGQLAEAEQLYRSILEADPRQIDCLHFLGMIALQSGRPAEAVDLLDQAIAANDKIAAYHGSLAEAYRELGRRDDAVSHYRKAVAIDPGYWAAHSLLADLLRDAGDSAGAIAHYRDAVAAKPDLAPAQHNRASLLLERGHVNEALDAAWRALAAQDSENTRALFVQCVRYATELPGEPQFRGLMTRALSEVWARPVELASAALTLVGASGTIRTAVAAIDGVWPRRVHPTILAPCMPVLMQDELLHRVMESTPVCDMGLERLLSCARTLLLDAALDPSGDIGPEMLPFACALARQCFVNEYVFHLPDVERDGTVALRGKLMGDLSGTKPVLALALIAYACFAPLRSLDRTAAILKRDWPPAMQALLDEQLREPEEEARYRAATPRLTSISDETSVRVRQQYEDNPYPRWARPAPVRPVAGLGAYLREELALGTLRDPPEAREILIAGCGTGQQPIETARRFPAARVLGIDLSLSSLAHAQRKAAELAVGNVSFGQADILAFDPPQPFDLIEACGVLHHLADPFAGWSKLLRLLKPGAVMRLGLYSALARTDIVAAREFAAAGGYDGTPDSIRSCRQNLMKSADPRLQRLPASPDFYSTSACRDLLLHVQEHRLTLSEIAAFLVEHRLSFLGFELGAPALAQYRTRFPDDAALTDLAKWHLFESEHPDTFGGMYVFWVQRGE
jgi:SAM-dependent methyltransferase/thioredoxin-like negative regulator of GroEL